MTKSSSLGTPEAAIASPTLLGGFRVWVYRFQGLGSGGAGFGVWLEVSGIGVGI